MTGTPIAATATAPTPTSSTPCLFDGYRFADYRFDDHRIDGYRIDGYCFALRRPITPAATSATAAAPTITTGRGCRRANRTGTRTGAGAERSAVRPARAALSLRS